MIKIFKYLIPIIIAFIAFNLLNYFTEYSLESKLSISFFVCMLGVAISSEMIESSLLRQKKRAKLKSLRNVGLKLIPAIKTGIDDKSYVMLEHTLDAVENILLDCKDCCDPNSNQFREFGKQFTIINGIKMVIDNIEYETEVPFDPLKSKDHLNNLEIYLKKGFRDE